MARRTPLRKQLSSAWRRTIAQHYDRGDVNSERALQAIFCAELLRQFDRNSMKRRILVEPRIRIPGSRKAPHPDLVICNRQRVIGVVELKYTPRVCPSFGKDLQTLGTIRDTADRICVQNLRFVGPEGRLATYSVAPDLVLCWAGVHAGYAGYLADGPATRLGSQFLELHAETENGQPATVYVK